jgi:nickel/cobalt exporter
LRRTFVAAAAFVLGMPAGSAAHRLDEYLQAARVSLARDRITLELDLMPGANIAPAILTFVDGDSDKTISPIEAEAYGQVVLADLVMKLDGRPIAMTLTRMETSSIEELCDGAGSIQLRATGSIEALDAGRHQLYFRNDHRPAPSVYLVNALIPEDGGVGVVRQDRDLRQQAVRIDYNVGLRWLAQVLWLVAGVGGLSALLVLRRSGS